MVNKTFSYQTHESNMITGNLECVKQLLTYKAVAEASAQGITMTHLLFGISSRAVQSKACMRRLVRASRGRTLKHSGSFLSTSKKPGSNATGICRCCCCCISMLTSAGCDSECCIAIGTCCCCRPACCWVPSSCCGSCCWPNCTSLA